MFPNNYKKLIEEKNKHVYHLSYFDSSDDEDNDTDDIDINIDKLNEFNKYKKPWYELTQYNFNYFRNAIKEHPNTVSDKLRRVYGNYFVVRFIFNNSDNKRIQFESLECAQTQFRKL